MAGIGVRITIDGNAPILNALVRLALNAGDKSTLMEEIGINLVENARLRFSDQKDPSGNTWKPSIRAQAQGGETLRDTGRLLASLTHLVTGDVVEYGTNVVYAPWLHFGATIRATGSKGLRFKVPGFGWVRKNQVTLPPRPFIGLDSEDETLVLTIIENFLRPV